MRSPGPAEIANRVLAFFAANKRALLWRQTREAYPIWISEIMLQQTRVETVIPYFERWMERFPTLPALAAAPLDDVFAAWSGLGYYSRARNIHRCAQIANESGGRLPRKAAELRALPGIGRYTAGAISSQAYGDREPVVDGNVARVLARLYAIELDVKSTQGQRELWRIAAELVPAASPGEFNQGLMELGQAVCTPRKPDCQRCPLSRSCLAYRGDRQEELPVLPARKKRNEKVLLSFTAALIRRRADILLGQRPVAGLYAGLWEIPAADSREELARILPGLDLDAKKAMTREQELSHRRLRIDVFRGSIPRKPRKARGYNALVWHPVSQLGDLGVSSATAAIVAALT